MYNVKTLSLLYTDGDSDRHHQRGGGARPYGISNGPSDSGNGRGRGRGGGHPAHLTGKAIGLYYRDKYKKNAKKEQQESKASVGFKLDPRVSENIELMLEETKPPYAPRLGQADGLRADDSIGARYTHIGDSQFKRKFLEIVSGNIQQNLSKALLMATKLHKNTDLDNKLLEEHKERQNSPGYKSMMNFRAKLPSYSMRQSIVDLVNNNQVMVISGETGNLDCILIEIYRKTAIIEENLIDFFLCYWLQGCGKTTQVAQFILDDAIERGNGSVTKVVCTQPRRISAISVAERVAAERGENLGKSVGYQIRLEKYETSKINNSGMSVVM